MKFSLFFYLLFLFSCNVIAGNPIWEKATCFAQKILSDYKTTDHKNSEKLQINAGDTVVFDLSQAVISNGLVNIPVYIQALDTINSLDFSLKYNHNNIAYSTIQNLTNYMQGVVFNYNQTDSVLRFTSYSFQNYDINIPLLLIRFQMLSGMVLRSDLYALTAYLNGEAVGTKVIGDAVMMLSFNVINPSCTATSDGSIELTVNGGTAPYNYFWSNADTSTNLIALQAGNYSVTVVDQNGYIKIDSVVVSDPSLLFQETNPTCATYADGSIELDISGGIPPYAFSWSNNDTTKDIHHIGAGLYFVTVTDSTGCILIGSQEISDSAGMHFNSFIDVPTCPGDHDGSAEVNISGGLPPYSYFWSNHSIQNTIDSLAAGIYFISVTDQQACLLVKSVTISEPPEIMLLLNKTNISCTYANDGKIDLFVSGGFPPFQYLWSNFETNRDIDSLIAGTYFITVSDSKGCSVIDSSVINISPEIHLRFDKSDVSCYGFNNGNAEVFVEGGQPPFSYLWSNGSTAQSIDNLYPGNFIVTVSQNTQCIKIDTVKIENAFPISISVNYINPTCSSVSNGSIMVVTEGGKYPYLFTWSNDGKTDNISNLEQGAYILSVTDANNCLLSDTVFLKASDQACLEIFSAFSPNADGKNDVWNIFNIEAYPECMVNIYDIWEVNVFSSKGYEHPWDGKYNGNALPAATYYYVIDLGNNIKNSGAVTILN